LNDAGKLIVCNDIDSWLAVLLMVMTCLMIRKRYHLSV